MPRLTVILPVYDGRPVVEQCVESLLPTLLDGTELLIVDDASTDEGLALWLHGVAEQCGSARYLRNDANLGFAASVNRGLAAAAGDVVILNSDTRVPSDWLERLTACAHSADDIGTVTPFTNSGSICSYPVFCAHSELPAGLELAALDGLFARANARTYLEIPTGVGFCMYISRSCIEAVGMFDAEHFRHGYGEENDFCLRASEAGFRHLLCGDLFVYHEGGASFGDSRKDLMARADSLMAERHPGYGQLVEAFIAGDAVAPLRAAVDELRREIPGQLPVLFEESARREDIARAESRELRDLLRVQSAQIPELERLLQAAREDFKATDQELRRSREAYATLERQLQGARDHAARVEGEFRSLEERLRELLPERDRLEERCRRLTFEVTEARAQRDERQQLLDETRAELENLNRRLLVRAQNRLNTVLGRG